MNMGHCTVYILRNTYINLTTEKGAKDQSDKQYLTSSTSTAEYENRHKVWLGWLWLWLGLVSLQQVELMDRFWGRSREELEQE